MKKAQMCSRQQLESGSSMNSPATTTDCVYG
jgi:hypothetical protein